jgi:hypothetical protein
VSWEKGTPAVPDDTVSMVPSCSDLFILGDVRASILADLRKFMHLTATGRMMSSGTNCPPAVTSTQFLQKKHYIKQRNRVNNLKKRVK